MTIGGTARTTSACSMNAPPDRAAPFASGSPSVTA